MAAAQLEEAVVALARSPVSPPSGTVARARGWGALIESNLRKLDRAVELAQELLAVSRSQSGSGSASSERSGRSRRRRPTATGGGAVAPYDASYEHLSIERVRGVV